MFLNSSVSDFKSVISLSSIEGGRSPPLYPVQGGTATLNTFSVQGDYKPQIVAFYLLEFAINVEEIIRKLKSNPIKTHNLIYIMNGVLHGLWGGSKKICAQIVKFPPPSEILYSYAPETKKCIYYLPLLRNPSYYASIKKQDKIKNPILPQLWCKIL